MLLDDYVKFIRFGQWRIDQTKQGVLAFITNHGYLDNPTFRGMRRSLEQSFNQISVMDLHGNTKKKEVAPDGSKDENVFDIQQGVSISLFSKDQKNNTDKITDSNILHTHLYGTRDTKYDWLQAHDALSTDWQEIKSQAPFYLLIPQNTDLLSEYDQGWKITDVMPINSTGVKTHRDHFVIDFNDANLKQRIADFRDLQISDDDIANQYSLSDTNDWKLRLRRCSLATNQNWEQYLTKCLYRPFDIRAYFHHQDVVDRPRNEVMNHIINHENLALVFMRQVAIQEGYNHFISTNLAVDNRAFYSNKGTMQISSLYLYSNRTEITQDRRINFSPEFLKDLTAKLGTTPTPEAIFYYIYAVFHSPTYRSRYAEFLKIDFPRVPLTSSVDLFQQLATYGEALVNLHLMKSPGLEQLITQFEGIDRTVDPGHPKYANGKVTINKRGAGFSGVPEAVWNFYVGGYQVCHKWLKDRKGRTLSPEDITHYQRIVVALQETIRLMQQIDEAIPGFPLP